MARAPVSKTGGWGFESLQACLCFAGEARKMIKKIQMFVENVQREMSKVSWPTRDELMNSSMIVVVVSTLFAIYVFFADLIISKLVEYLY